MNKFSKIIIISLGVILGMFGLADYSHATTINVVNANGQPSCEQADVQAAINAASDGDIVSMSTGTCKWTIQVSMTNKGITIQGAGIDQTIIVDNVTNYKSPLQIIMTQDKAFRITGLTFDATQAQALNHSWGQIQITGIAKGWRVDHIKIDNMSYVGIAVAGSGGETYGLIDNSIFNKYLSYSASGVYILGNMSGTPKGDASWDLTYTPGTANAVYIENNIFNCYGMGNGGIDAYGGARYVFRYNQVNGTNVNHHGFDSGGYASPHTFEIYNNTFNNTGSNIFTTIGLLRGGTGVIFNNTITGNYNSFAVLANFRSDPDGEGMVTNSSDSSTILDNASGNFNFLKNGPRSSWALYNQTDGSYCLATVTSNTRMTCSSPLTGGATNLFRNSDVYAVSYFTAIGGMCTGYGTLDGNTPGQQGYPCYQQIGRTTGQALAPLYLWGNNFKGNLSPIAGVSGTRTAALHILTNRDYYNNTQKPGYTPYAYPHPLQAYFDNPPDTTPPAAPTGLTVN